MMMSSLLIPSNTQGLWAALGTEQVKKHWSLEAQVFQGAQLILNYFYTKKYWRFTTPGAKKALTFVNPHMSREPIT